ncbi:ABC transporter permease [Granulosicoccus antarcticus]|uniref:Inner membrane transport permease YbhS n=1 Tax=Granulosicoccus antarcticus IMCC3135 TaxID=1192854 RepID=A0A2Z2NRM5_9GAMM|nr:ABC transporter permease [Granulosicoccus antarcticus]ASJ72661.1 Inner membrane transport permease YbhS [Granulosicoccus antarcticus IMCC3135]
MSRRRRLRALVHKESIQVLRDPSALLIALVMPFILLFLFAYAVSLDVKGVRFGVIIQSEGPASTDLLAAFESSEWLDVRVAHDRRELEPQLLAGDIRGMLVIPADYEAQFATAPRDITLQLITDGSQPNTATFVSNYALGIYKTWLASYPGDEMGMPAAASQALITAEPRFWFNPELESRRVLLPGAIAIIMTMIATLLTALVVSREWERGTMEALLSTPASTAEILLAKLAPYFILGLAATVVCTSVSLMVFEVPLRGSLTALLLLSIVFLLPALGQGLLISAIARNQFIAAQIALITGFLPAFLLSGFLFEIESMPLPIRALTTLVSARWYVEGLQTVFLAGDVWCLLGKDMLILACQGVALVLLAVWFSRRGLDE